jgi:GMP synthase PP-ATPase subunit
MGVIRLRMQKPISFDDLLKELQGQKNNENDKNQISLDMLFNESFMSKYSSFKSFNEFLMKGNFQADTVEEINNIPEELFDRHVARETKFANWKSMLDQANMDYKS